MHIIRIAVCQEQSSCRTTWTITCVDEHDQHKCDLTPFTLVMAFRPACTFLDAAELRTWLMSVITAVAPAWRMSLSFDEVYLTGLLQGTEVH
jgi:hypothetical protein